MKNVDLEKTSVTNTRQSHIIKKYSTKVQKNGFFYFSVSLLCIVFVVYVFFQVEVPRDLQKSEYATTSTQENSKYVIQCFPLIEVKESNTNENAKIYEEIPHCPTVVLKKEYGCFWNTIVDAPVHPDCKALSTNKERRKCFSEQFQVFFKKEFSYPNTTKQVKKMYVAFTINEKGLLTNIKTRNTEKVVHDEVKRVLQLFPKVTPAKYQGKNVCVDYVFPIPF